MKTLIFLTLAIVGTATLIDVDSVKSTLGEQPQLIEEVNPLSEKIILVDANGIITNEFVEEDFISNRLTISEMNQIRKSDFLLKSLGNSYYLETK